MKRLFILSLLCLILLFTGCDAPDTEDTVPETTADPIASMSLEELVHAAVETSDLSSWGLSSDISPYSPISILRDSAKYPALEQLLKRDDLDTVFAETIAPILREYLDMGYEDVEHPEYWKNAISISDMIRTLCPHISYEIDNLFRPADVLSDTPTEELIEVFVRDTRLQKYLSGGTFTRHALTEFAEECPELSSIIARDNDMYALCAHIETNHQQLREELGDAQADALLEIVWCWAPHYLCYSLSNEELLRKTCERNYLQIYSVSEMENAASLLVFTDFANSCPPLYELLMRNDGLEFMKEYIPVLVAEYNTSDDAVLIQAGMKLEFIYKVLFP